MNLVELIKLAVRDGQFVVSVHARQRLAERNVRLWQIESALDEAKIIEDRPDDEPNASIVVEELLPDGTQVTVVWSWLAVSRRAKLVTVYFPY
ncbi:MAG TPA: DUF4258 domain-containing protein [Pirellulales bacterium]|nr:DUF4258 domain-containing protein [Pirellulales bacterium]